MLSGHKQQSKSNSKKATQSLSKVMRRIMLVSGKPVYQAFTHQSANGKQRERDGQIIKLLKYPEY